MRSIISAAVLGLASVGPSFGCGEDVRYYVMHEEHLIETTGSRYLGGACVEVAEGTVFATGFGTADFSAGIRYEGREDGVNIVLASSESTTERFFDERWLRGEGPAEDIVLRLDSMTQLRVHLFGGRQCEKPREPVSP